MFLNSFKFLYFTHGIPCSDIANYRGRNYTFLLNDTIAIDASYMGNEARYINHRSQTTGMVNAKASGMIFHSNVPFFVYTFFGS